MYCANSQQFLSVSLFLDGYLLCLPIASFFPSYRYSAFVTAESSGSAATWISSPSASLVWKRRILVASRLCFWSFLCEEHLFSCILVFPRLLTTPPLRETTAALHERGRGAAVLLLLLRGAPVEQRQPAVLPECFVWRVSLVKPCFMLPQRCQVDLCFVCSVLRSPQEAVFCCLPAA